MARPSEDSTVAHPEVLTLHWEGPPSVTLPVEPRSAASLVAADGDRARERELEQKSRQRARRGRELWQQIRREAGRRGDLATWERKLHAYSWVKLDANGSAGDYARTFEVNHATVRTWIADVAKLAYEVGYRLHEDKLLLVGDAPDGLRRLRELVNADAASEESRTELCAVRGEFAGKDGYFHLNEGHILRARGDLRGSDATLCIGLTIAEARPLRSLLWNARGQTLWDCSADSSHPLRDHLARAERAFRRAAALDRSTYFPFVNLAQMAVDARDPKRAEYWIAELSAARKGMDEPMRKGLADYLEQAEWAGAVECQRFWRQGPVKWMREAAASVALVLAFLGFVAALPAPAEAGSLDRASRDVAIGAPALPTDDCANSGAGGN